MKSNYNWAYTTMGVFFITLVTLKLTLKPSQADSVIKEQVVSIQERAPKQSPDQPTLNLKAKKDTTVKTKKVASSKVVFLYGPVTAYSANVLIKDIEAAAETADSIYLVIDSPGGAVFEGAKILTAIQAQKIPVYTVCKGMCASMAFVIHQYGTKRLAYPRAILMAHQASGGMQGTVGQMDSLLSFLKNFLNKTDDFIASRVGITGEQFRNMYKNELWLDAEDALNLKFVDGLVYLKIDGSDNNPANSALEEEEQRNKKANLNPTTPPSYDQLPKEWPTKDLGSFK